MEKELLVHQEPLVLLDILMLHLVLLEAQEVLEVQVLLGHLVLLDLRDFYI